MNDLKLGTVVTWKNAPHVVTFAQHVQMGRGGAILRTKLKNILTGNVFEETFKAGDRLEEAELDRSKASYLYSDDGMYHFMDETTFDQFALAKDQLGDKVNYLKEGLVLQILLYEGQPVNIDLPIKIPMKITHTADAVKGNTASGNVSKEAELETGLTIKVPLFIKSGDTVIVNTETGQYVERTTE